MSTLRPLKIIQVADALLTKEKLENFDANSILLNNTGSAAAPIFGTVAQAQALLNVEDGADVTDGTNVAAAGATMDADTSLAGNGYFLDEDDMNSDDATKVPSQQSVKAYVDAEVSGAIAGIWTDKGNYNADTNSPDLDTTPIAGILQGDTYTVSVAGTFFTIPVEIGDVVRALQDTPTLEAHWAVTQANLTPASIKTQYESNSDTNAYTDSEKTVVGNTSNTNSGDEVSATDAAEGIVELATQAEVNTGTDTSRAITPATLAGSDLANDVAALTLTTVTKASADNGFTAVSGNVVIWNIDATSNMNLPAAPTTATVVAVSISAAAATLTVSGNGKNILGGATASTETFTIVGEGTTFRYNGTSYYML